MAKEPAEGLVFIDKVMQTVKVTVQTLHHDTHDKDLPQLHARTAKVMADMGSQVFLQKGKKAGPQLPVAINMLQANQESRDVITGPVVNRDPGNVDVAKFTVGLDDMSHGAKPPKINGIWMKKGSGMGNWH